MKVRRSVWLFLVLLCVGHFYIVQEMLVGILIVFMVCCMMLPIVLLAYSIQKTWVALIDRLGIK
jgi:hypothetical protein